LAVLREDEGNSADPPSTVDLDAGVAVLRLPGKKKTTAESDQAAAGETATGRPAADDEP
jgi:hypothetical protein